MEEALKWIFLLAIGLFVVFFAIKTVFTWLKGFLGVSINFLRMFLIAVGVIGAIALIMYPAETIMCFHQIWDWIAEFWNWMTNGRSVLKR